MTRVAAVDCGTNTIRLLVADGDGHGGLVEVDRQMEIVRLGQGVDATGEFHPDALARTFAATQAYAERIAEAGVPPERVSFVATSAARDAANRQEFFDGVHSRLGVLPEVISGDLEAELAFTGALSGVHVDAEPVLVMDIGGGSTELILGTAQAQITAAVSLNIGSVRVTERFFATDPPTPDALAAATVFIDRLLDGRDLTAVATFIGVAGTVTTLAATYQELPSYDRAKVHGARIPREALIELSGRLARMRVAEIRAIASMHPGRADVIAAGALVAARVLARTHAAELVVSETDILDGIALRLLRR